MTEFLASATLAQLYLAQGHLSKARRIVDDVLRRDPYDGAALVLLQRLRLAEPGRLHVERRGTRIVLSWSELEDADTLHLVWTMALIGRLDRPPACTIGSTAVTASSGQHVIDVGAAPGSIAACLGALDSDGVFVPAVLASPFSWDGSPPMRV